MRLSMAGSLSLIALSMVSLEEMAGWTGWKEVRRCTAMELLQVLGDGGEAWLAAEGPCLEGDSDPGKPVGGLAEFGLVGDHDDGVNGIYVPFYMPESRLMGGHGNVPDPQVLLPLGPGAEGEERLKHSGEAGVPPHSLELIDEGYPLGGLVLALVEKFSVEAAHSGAARVELVHGEGLKAEEEAVRPVGVRRLYVEAAGIEALKDHGPLQGEAAVFLLVQGSPLQVWGGLLGV
jgi:hypothetical protein